MEKILGSGRYFDFLCNDQGYEYITRTRGTGVIAVIAAINEKMVLIEQYRAAVKSNVIEIPAGLVGDESGHEQETYETAAHRELLEEAGFKATRMELLFLGPSAPGLTSEVVHFFYATGLTQVGEGGGDEREKIKVHLVPFKEIHSFCRNRLVDAKVFAGLHFCLNQL